MGRRSLTTMTIHGVTMIIIMTMMIDDDHEDMKMINITCHFESFGDIPLLFIQDTDNHTIITIFIIFQATFK